MRNGRLQASTLASIWRSLEPNSSDANDPLADSFGPTQKQYIPTTFDSPLYRLVSVPVESDEDVDCIGATGEEDPEADGDTTVSQVSDARESFQRQSRVSRSVPEIASDGLDRFISPSRNVQSLVNLYHPRPSNPVNGEPTRNEFVASTETKLESKSSKPKDAKADPEKDWVKEYSHIDIDWSMQAMDVLYNASFYEYIRDERNVDLSAIRLCRIIKDYKPRQVSNALLWMTQGWSVENTSKLLRTLFADWLPDLAGASWPKNPQCSLCVAYLLISEPATTSALFLRSLTQGWTRKESIELVTYLDSVLKWSTTYLQELTEIYASAVYPNVNESPVGIFGTGEEKHGSPSTVDLIHEDLQEASQKLRLEVAEYHLAVFRHWSSCHKCKERQSCEELDTIARPDMDEDSLSSIESMGSQSSLTSDDDLSSASSVREYASAEDLFDDNSEEGI